jgi:hypothetical protein
LQCNCGATKIGYKEDEDSLSTIQYEDPLLAKRGSSFIAYKNLGWYNFDRGPSFVNRQNPLLATDRILCWQYSGYYFGNRQDPLLVSCRILFGIRQDPLFVTGRILFLHQTGPSFEIMQDPILASDRILFWLQSGSSFGNRQVPIWTIGRILFSQQAGSTLGQDALLKNRQDPLLATVRILFKKPCGPHCWKQEEGPSVATGGAGGELPEAEECGTDG